MAKLDKREPYEKNIPNNPPCQNCGHARSAHSIRGCGDVTNKELLIPCTCKVKHVDIKDEQ